MARCGSFPWWHAVGAVLLALAGLLAPAIARAQAFVSYFVMDGLAPPALGEDSQPGRAELSHAGSRFTGAIGWNHLVSSAASLPQGSLHGLLQATTLGLSNADLGVNASLLDSLSFSGPGPRWIELVLRVDGAMLSAAGNSSIEAAAFLSLGGSSSGGSVQWNGHAPAVAWFALPGDARLLDATPGSLAFSLHLRLLVEPGVSYPFFADLSVSAAPGSNDILSADFGHTAQLSLQLPADLQMHSASGLLLSAVPEPATAWLLPAGLLLLGWRVRRRAQGVEGRSRVP